MKKRVLMILNIFILVLGIFPIIVAATQVALGSENINPSDNIDLTLNLDSIKNKETNYKANQHVLKPKIEWVTIPAGTFTMGSPENEADRTDREVQHQVSLSAFKMSKYEITFEQYDLFCEATGRSKPSDEGWGRNERPVINVSWDDASAFAEWMGCRLPTEAEWEYACRAGTTTPFSTGDCLSTSQANYDGNYPYINCMKGEYRQKTMPVGNFPPNPWGLYDMHGNVYEWCSDFFTVYLPEEPQTNPTGPSSGYDRVFRGGSWFSRAFFCRSAYRNSHFSPNDRRYFLGFRLVSGK